MSLTVYLLLLASVNCLSDVRMCSDIKCEEYISEARGMDDYDSDEAEHLSFKKGQIVLVTSKSAGTDPALWGGEVDGKKGFFPSHLVTEFKLFDPNPSHLVPVKAFSDEPMAKDRDPTDVSEGNDPASADGPVNDVESRGPEANEQGDATESSKDLDGDYHQALDPTESHVLQGSDNSISGVSGSDTIYQNEINPIVNSEGFVGKEKGREEYGDELNVDENGAVAEVEVITNAKALADSVSEEVDGDDSVSDGDDSKGEDGDGPISEGVDRDDSVPEGKIQKDSVTDMKDWQEMDNSVAEDRNWDDSVTDRKDQDDSVTDRKDQDDSVTDGEDQDDSVTHSESGDSDRLEIELIKGNPLESELGENTTVSLENSAIAKDKTSGNHGTGVSESELKNSHVENQKASDISSSYEEDNKQPSWWNDLGSSIGGMFGGSEKPAAEASAGDASAPSGDTTSPTDADNTVSTEKKDEPGVDDLDRMPPGDESARLLVDENEMQDGLDNEDPSSASEDVDNEDDLYYDEDGQYYDEDDEYYQEHDEDYKGEEMSEADSIPAESSQDQLASEVPDDDEPVVGSDGTTTIVIDGTTILEHEGEEDVIRPTGAVDLEPSSDEAELDSSRVAVMATPSLDVSVSLLDTPAAIHIEPSASLEDPISSSSIDDTVVATEMPTSDDLSVEHDEEKIQEKVEEAKDDDDEMPSSIDGGSRSVKDVSSLGGGDLEVNSSADGEPSRPSLPHSLHSHDTYLTSDYIQRKPLESTQTGDAVATSPHTPQKASSQDPRHASIAHPFMSQSHVPSAVDGDSPQQPITDQYPDATVETDTPLGADEVVSGGGFMQTLDDFIGVFDESLSAFVDKLPPSIQPMFVKEPFIGLSPPRALLLAVVLLWASSLCFIKALPAAGRGPSPKFIATQEKFAKLHEDLFIATKERENLEKELEMSKKKLMEYSSRSSASQSEVDDLKQQLQTATLHNSALRDTMAAQQEQVLQLTSTVNTQQESITLLDSQKYDLEQRMTDITNHTCQVEYEMTSLRTTLQTSQAGALEAHQKLENMNVELSVMEEYKNKLQLEVERSEDSVEDMKKEVETYKTEIESLKATVATKNDDLNALQGLYLRLEAVAACGDAVDGSDDGEEEGREERIANAKSLAMKNMLQKMADVHKAETAMQEAEQERNDLREQHAQECDKRADLQSQVESLLKSKEDLEERFHKAELSVQEADIKVKVLKEHFKEKEIAMQRVLGAQQIKEEENVSELGRTGDQSRLLETENESLKAQVRELKDEILRVGKEARIEIRDLEKKAHDNWLHSREMERRQEESNRENTQLRQKIMDLEQRHELDMLHRGASPHDGPPMRPLPRPPMDMMNGPPLLRGTPPMMPRPGMPFDPRFGPPMPPPPGGRFGGPHGPPMPPMPLMEPRPPSDMHSPSPHDRPLHSSSPADRRRTPPFDSRGMPPGPPMPPYRGPMGRPDFGGPDRDRPDRGGPDRGWPDRGGPDRGWPDRGGPDRDGPDRGSPDRDRPDRGSPDRDRPDRGSPDRDRPDRSFHSPDVHYRVSPEHEGPFRRPRGPFTPDRRRPSPPSDYRN